LGGEFVIAVTSKVMVFNSVIQIFMAGTNVKFIDIVAV
jgi:hypothetical protein